MRKRLPAGIENFDEIRTQNYYYVDKTGLIADMLKSGAKVTLFTRPRRFGKTLNMSMLESFFSPLSDKSIFDGLKIREETGICEKYMGKYPVISISLKDVDADDLDTAYGQLSQIIREAADKVDEQTQDDDRIRPIYRKALSRLLQEQINNIDLYSGLYTLTCILEKHYGQKVIILIDEYDVPLAKANENGYYEKMVRLIRNLFQKALKSNNCLHFAVLTGCMRISKESIFTGLNNLTVRTVSDEEFDEYFGFTDAEVRDMLDYYGMAGYYDVAKDWYDGYSFGQTSVYCPWDIICYGQKLLTDTNKTPENFWLNSSSNEAVRRLIRCGDPVTIKGDIEALLNGETLEKIIQPNLTYPEMYSSVDNIWSVLYTTGYLTHRGPICGDRIALAIPNKEICNIFARHILELFQENVNRDGEAQKVFSDALKGGKVPVIE